MWSIWGRFLQVFPPNVITILLGTSLVNVQREMLECILLHAIAILIHSFLDLTPQVTLCQVKPTLQLLGLGRIIIKLTEPCLIQS